MLRKIATPHKMSKKYISNCELLIAKRIHKSYAPLFNDHLNKCSFGWKWGYEILKLEWN